MTKTRTPRIDPAPPSPGHHGYYADSAFVFSSDVKDWYTSRFLRNNRNCQSRIKTKPRQ